MAASFPNTNVPIYIMCPPDCFALSPPDPEHGFANDMIAREYEGYFRDPELFREKAEQQWNAFVAALKETLGAKVLFLDPKPYLDDMVFTADPSLSFVRKDGSCISIVSKMTHPLRGDETLEHFHFLSGGFPENTIKHSPFSSEGNGDNLYDSHRNVFWSGYTPNPSSTQPAVGRSSKEFHRFLSVETGVKVLSLEVKRPYFHIDTTLSALPGGHIVIYKEGIAEHSFETLYREAFIQFDMDPSEYLIEVSKEEAEQFACNMVCFEDKIIMPRCGTRIPTLLKEKGYKVSIVDLSCFIKAAGGPHCLTNQLNMGI